jgi:hypothetical protein
MDKRAVGRKAALLTGLGAVGIAIFAGVFWSDLAAQYYLRNLREQPASLEEALSSDSSLCPKYLNTSFSKTRSDG